MDESIVMICLMKMDALVQVQILILKHQEQWKIKLKVVTWF